MDYYEFRGDMNRPLISRDNLPPRSGVINILHPGYPEDNAHLFSLAGHDSVSGSIASNVVLTACAIISNNKFDGKLLTGPKSTDSLVQIKPMLNPGDYWWHVPNPTGQPASCSHHCANIFPGENTAPYRYPIIPSFRDWKFPRNPPPIWCGTASPSSSPPTLRSKCRLTEDGLATEGAHIVPASETDWYLQNRMSRWSTEIIGNGGRGTLLGSTIDNELNVLSLRADIHHLWDLGDFTFIPKQTTPDESQIGVHCISAKAELVLRYHGRRLLDQSVPRELLLARFAWCLFRKGIADFLLNNVDRLLVVTGQDGTTVEKVYSAAECRVLALNPRPKSTSPKKRKGVGNETEQRQEQEDEEYQDEDEDEDGLRDRGRDTGLIPYRSLKRARDTTASFDSAVEGLSEDTQSSADRLIEIEELSRGRKRWRRSSIYDQT